LGGGVVGCLGYELGRLIEPPRDGIVCGGDLPLALLRRYDPLLAYDRSREQYTLLCSDPRAGAPWLERLAAPAPSWDGPLGGPLAPLLAPARYREAVARILAYLAAGDVYQVNLTQPFTAPLVAPAWALAAQLGRQHPVPYGAYLDLGSTQVVANSPELFLRRRGRRVETRPIKGTRPRGDGPSDDAALAVELLRELEPWPRGPYTGAFGFLDPRGDLELGLAIRTAIVTGGTVRYHAGGGIVADSDPERELAEAWLKTAALRRALGEEPRRG